MYLTDQMFR